MTPKKLEELADRVQIIVDQLYGTDAENLVIQGNRFASNLYRLAEEKKQKVRAK